MTYERSELRAFPRLSCGQPAHIRIGDLRLDGQIIDISVGGCKLLPCRLAELVAGDYRPGSDLILIGMGGEHKVTLRWATPNYSALGCTFPPKPFGGSTAIDEGLAPDWPGTYLCQDAKYLWEREQGPDFAASSDPTP